MPNALFRFQRVSPDSAPRFERKPPKEPLGSPSPSGLRDRGARDGERHSLAPVTGDRLRTPFKHAPRSTSRFEECSGV